MGAARTLFGLILIEAAIGSLLLMWIAPTYRVVRHGYEFLTGATALIMFGSGVWMLRSPLTSAGLDPTGTGTLAWQLLAAAAVLGVVALVLLMFRLEGPAQGAGILSVIVGIGSFAPLAAFRAGAWDLGPVLLSGLELILGTWVLGATWIGLMLGHWYMFERRLDKKYMQWVSWANVGAVGAALGAIALSARHPMPCATAIGDDRVACALQFSPLLATGSLTLMVGVGVAGLLALLAGFNVKLAAEGGRSIQAATGMFYLAVILAFFAEFAAKVRFV